MAVCRALCLQVLLAFSFLFVAFPINAFFAGRVARVQMKQQELEGELRVYHSRVGLNAESINFYGGEATELALLEDKAAPVTESARACSYILIKQVQKFC